MADPKAAMAAILEKYSPKNSKSVTTGAKAAETESTSKAKKAMDEILEKYSPKPDVLDALPGLRGKETEIFKPSPIYDYTGASRKKAGAKQDTEPDIEYDSGSVLKLGAGPLSSNAVTSGVVSGKLELTSRNKDGKYSVEKNTEYVAPKKKADIIDRSPARMAELEAVKNPSEAQIEELAIIKKELAEKAEAAKSKEEREPGDNWFSWLGRSRDSTLPLSTADTQAQKAIGNTVGALTQNVAGSLMSVIATLNELDARTRARDEADSAKLKAAQSALEKGEEVDLGRSEETWRADMTAKTDEYTEKVKNDLVHEFSGILMNNAEQLRNEAYKAAGDEGKFLVDLLYTGGQMAVDLIANAIVPGSGLWLMSARVFGQSAYEARENGADAATQFVTGLKSAVIEYLTEKMGGGAFKRIYGAGMVDNAIESVLGRLFKTDTGRTVIRYIMTAVNEGNEEVLSDVLNPVADRLLGLDDGEGALFTDEDLGQMWYDWMLGTALGGIGAAVNIAGGSNAEQNADLRLTESAQKALVESGLESDTNTESYKLAEKYKKTLDSGRLLSNKQVKKLTEANDAAIRNEVALQSAIDAVKQTVPERAARMFAERGEQASPELISGITNLITDQQVTQEQVAAIVASDNSAEVVQQLAQEYITQEAPEVQESAPVDGSMETWDGNNIVESMFPNEVKSGILTEDEVAGFQSYYDESGRSIDLNELETMVRDYIENKKEAKTNEGRKQSSDRSVGREPDMGPGEQAGSVQKSAGRDQSEERGNDARGEETRRSSGKKPQREKISGKSLNIPHGTDSQKLTVVKPDGVNARIVNAFSAAAKSITLVNGAIEQQKNDAVITVSGLTTADGRVFARMDHRLYNGTKLLLHECGHLYMDDSAMRSAMHNAAADVLTGSKLEELANSYALLWKGLYKMPEGITTDEELADYFENNPDAYTEFLEAYEQEIWCDALAGLDRIKAAGATKLTDTVRSIFKDYTGIDVDAILNGMQSDETEFKESEELDADIEERSQAPPDEYEQISMMSAAETAEAEKTAMEDEVEEIAEEAAAETPTESEADNDFELHIKAEEKKQPGEIKDFGEKIGGARKDIWAASGLTTYDMQQMTEAEKGKYVKKDSVWPKINYQELADSGIDKDVVFFIKQVRDSLPAAPQMNYNDADLDARREQYIEFVQAIRTGMESIRTKADAINAFENIMVGNGWYSTAGASSYSRGNWTKKGRDNIQITNKLINALSVSERRWNYDVVKKMEKMQFLVPKEDKLPAGVQIKFYDGDGYSRNDNWKPGTWYVTKGYTILSTNFESEKSAKEWAQTNIKPKGSGKTRFVPRQLESVHRIGRDYRNSNSTDIEGDDYMQTFGFRGGEFGNWVNQTERQVSLNYGFDALMDLADVLGIEPSSIALDGRLAIAFGARGHAGAAAHFEPEREVINLTKMNGAGSLAHEWLHALDYIGGKMLGQQKSMIEGRHKLNMPELTQLIEDMKSKPMAEDEALALAEQTEKRRRDSTERLINSYFKTADMTAEQIQKLDELKTEAAAIKEDMPKSMQLAEKISDLRKEYKGRVIPKEERTQLGYSIYRAGLNTGTNARTATDFYKNSKRFDKIHSKENNAGYWASDEEMMARAFACYVSDKLAANGMRSDYLSGSSELAVSFDTTPDDQVVVIKAIPEGEERAKLNEDFDALIEALKNKGVLLASAPATEEYAVTSYSIDEDEHSDNEDIRYSADEEGYIEDGYSARMTNSRIDYLIEDSGAGRKKDYAQMWITSINPTDFINLTTDKVQDRKLFDKYPGDYGTTVDEYDFIEGLKSNMRQTPYLNIDEYGNVIGHEGRHRMRALERKGVTSAEIVVKFYDSDGSMIKNVHAVNGRLETIERATFSNQMGTGQTASVENLVPLNLDHKDEVLKSYGEDHAAENDIRYSADEDSNGNELSEGQKEYFKHSQVRDDSGRLLVVYHGTPAQFTVFSHEKAGGLFCFTPSKTNADAYAQGSGGGRANNIEDVFIVWDEHPDVFFKYDEYTDGNYTDAFFIAYRYDEKTGEYISTGNAVNKSEIYRALDNYEAYPINPNATTGAYYLDATNIVDCVNDINGSRKVFKEVWNRAKAAGADNQTLNQIARIVNDFDYNNGYMFWLQTNDEWATKKWEETIVPILKDMGYDGLYYHDDSHKTYAVFDSNQAKLTSNLNPTEDDDIRYSADDALLVESDPDYADTLSRVREDARRYSAAKLEERISNFDGRIKGYEETANRTERMDLELQDLRNRRKVYGEALKRKKAKNDERRQANESAKTEAKAMAQRITEVQGRNRSKATLRDTIFRDFNIEEGRSEAADVINAFADKYAEQGRISRKDLNGLFDTLMEKGLFVAEAEDYAVELRAHLAGSSVRVPSYVKAEFGDDWINFYRRAWGNKIYLKIDSGSNGIDTWTQELAGSFGEGIFDTSADLKTQLERIVELAEQGRDEKMDLFHMAEYVRKREGRDTADAIVDELYQKLENAVKTYASNAKLEMELTYKNAFQQARDRAIRQENARRAQEKKELRERQQDTLKQLQILKRMRDTTSQEFREQIDRVLDGIDTIAVSAANAMNYSDKYNATWGSIVAMYNEAKANDPNWLPDTYVDKLMERIDGKHLDEMEPADLEQLYQAAVALRTKIYNTRNIIGSETNMMFNEAYDSVSGEMHGASKPKNRYGATWAAMRNAMNPNHYLECLAGWNPDSVWYKTFAKGLEDGERKMKRYVETSKQMLDEFARTHRNWLEVADGQGKNGIWYEVKVSPVVEWRKGDQPIFGKPITVYMTPLQKVHMYLESKNYDNLAHMLGGRVFADRELYSKGNKAEAFASNPIHLAPADVRRISSDLTEEEMKLANILERYYNTYAKGEINKVSNELYGFDRAMAGNYAPIFTKDTYNTFTPAIIDGTAEGVGHMKTRIKGARTPTVNISAMDAFNKHVSQTSRFVGMSIPLHNMNGILNWTQNGKKMRSVIEQEWSKGDLEYIENLVTELQNPHFADEGYIEKTIDKIQSAYIGSVFGFNPSVALKVFGSWNLASAELGFENVKGAFTKVDPELIRKYTSEYDVRVRGYASPEVARLVNSQGRIEKLIQNNKVTKELFGGGLMIHTDAMVARSIWAWSEAAVRNENPDLEVGTQEQIDAGQSPFYKAVAERYNTAIGNTQSMYDIMHRSALLRDEGAVSRAFTMFHTDIMQAANLLIKAKGEHDYYRKALAADPENKALQAKAAKYKNSVGKAAAGVVTSSMLVALVSVLNKLYKRRDEFYDENKEFMWDKFGIDYATYILKDFTGMMPGVDVVAGGLIDHFRGEKWYDVEVMGLSLFNDLVDKGIKVASKIIDGTATLEDYKDLAFLVARGFSLPLDNVERYTLGLFSWVAPEIGEAYNNMISPPDKSDLKGKSGEVLERDIYDMYKQFGLDRETTDELARLYDLGYDKIIYGATPDHITINGTEYELDDEAAERYSTALSETLSKVGEVISSDEYQEADDKERMGMLKRLNAYATETAKAAAVPEYDMSQWAESCKGLVDSGESIMTVAMMPYTEKSSSSSSEDNDPRYVKFIKAGVEYNNARDIEEKLTALVPDAGKTNVSDFQKIKAIAEMPIPESDKAAALEVIAENTNFIRKLYGATSSKYSLLEICDIYSAVIAKSEKGSFTQDNFKEVVSERGIPYDVASAIWLAKWEPKNNPYD